jgi:hypothetical protein
MLARNETAQRSLMAMIPLAAIPDTAAWTSGV